MLPTRPPNALGSCKTDNSRPRQRTIFSQPKKGNRHTSRTQRFKTTKQKRTPSPDDTLFTQKYQDKYSKHTISPFPGRAARWSLILLAATLAYPLPWPPLAASWSRPIRHLFQEGVHGVALNSGFPLVRKAPGIWEFRGKGFSFVREKIKSC